MTLSVMKRVQEDIVVPEGEPSIQSRTEISRLREIGVKKSKLQQQAGDPRFKYGLELSNAERQFLLRNRIEARTVVTTIQQEKTGQYLLRGNDSGGATVEVGHIVAYFGTTEAPLTLRHSFDNVIPNQTHSLVFGKQIVRVEVYRYRATYSVGVTFYMLSNALSGNGNGKPTQVKRSLFLGRSGRLDYVPETDEYFGLPEFLNERGAVHRVPDDLHDVVRKAVSLSSCVACNHDHFRLAGPLDVSNILNGRPSAKERKRQSDAAKAARKPETESHTGPSTTTAPPSKSPSPVRAKKHK